MAVTKNVTIPEPGGPLLCGTTYAGQSITGQGKLADTLADRVSELAGDTGQVKTDRVIQADTATLELPLEIADLQVRVDVIIPEPFVGNAICGTVVCGVPPTLCGDLAKGDHYTDYQVELDAQQANLYIGT